MKEQDNTDYFKKSGYALASFPEEGVQWYYNTKTTHKSALEMLEFFDKTTHKLKAFSKIGFAALFKSMDTPICLDKESLFNCYRLAVVNKLSIAKRFDEIMDQVFPVEEISVTRGKAPRKYVDRNDPMEVVEPSRELKSSARLNLAEFKRTLDSYARSSGIMPSVTYSGNDETGQAYNSKQEKESMYYKTLPF